MLIRQLYYFGAIFKLLLEERIEETKTNIFRNFYIPIFHRINNYSWRSFLCFFVWKLRFKLVPASLS